MTTAARREKYKLYPVKVRDKEAVRKQVELKIAAATTTRIGGHGVPSDRPVL